MKNQLKAKSYKLKAQKGQSLLEIIVAIAVGAIIVGGVVVSIVGILRGNVQSKQMQTAAGLTSEYFISLAGMSEKNWHDIYNLDKGSANKYFIKFGATSTIIQGEEGLISDDIINGLVGYWKFDEAVGTTTAFDATNNNNDGTVTGGATSTSACKLSRCLEFDGTEDYVVLGNVGAGIKTVMFWMKADVIVSKKIIDMNGTAQIEIDANSNVVATGFPASIVYVDGSSASATITAVWRHVAITDTTGVGASAMDIGRVSAGYFDGLLDDVRIYDRALSADEIWQIYNSDRYMRSFYVENVNRDANGAIAVSGTDDPSTQKITVTSGWEILAATDSFSQFRYFTRHSNRLFSQTDWSGGYTDPTDNPITATTTASFNTSTNIDYATSGQIRIEGY
ncbi:hypothetical protein A3A20_01325 [Candidatus Wolfebacteria bacterium RIFCSPLOWO2_01_FULL_45_19]|uniref:LamG-like jellyroll fold domain-containing protein n=1 Tax=Candidatus Wolfebacteria bacterium RIFCSPLOWO2_01_FULL_45_19 TaxID=1802557 RepID=A0A1F8DUT5_9BACT|nr:MAG: hypothetical protein UX23_C0004G0043 [Parcubacteria group bacterium GW2011_GWB1_45_9]OGM91568.1 MAG: hypothetical protein A3A20_01325 [Candidatus Wolfebacteria bacterium RIFCSPLOWO2_01_FULL_45_19]